MNKALRLCCFNVCMPASDRSVGGIDVDHDQRNLNIFLTIRRIEANETHGYFGWVRTWWTQMTIQKKTLMERNNILGPLKLKFSKQPRQENRSNKIASTNQSHSRDVEMNEFTMFKWNLLYCVCDSCSGWQHHHHHQNDNPLINYYAGQIKLATL